MPRPSTHTPVILADIIARLSNGEPLTSICRTDGYPDRRTVGNWRKELPEFDAAFLSARDDGFDAIAAECLAIADTPENGVETTTKPDGSTETREGDMLGHRKLRVETRLKLLAKWDPRRYGDRMALDHGVQDNLAERLKAARERSTAG